MSALQQLDQFYFKSELLPRFYGSRLFPKNLSEQKSLLSIPDRYASSCEIPFYLQHCKRLLNQSGSTGKGYVTIKKVHKVKIPSFYCSGEGFVLTAFVLRCFE